MCGIAGYFLRSGTAAMPERLLRMAERLRHRGPDGGASYAQADVGLVHTRLSIIDLAGGAQPLYAANNDVVLVANGEIYNYIELRTELEAAGHVFSTNSDCETILHAYCQYGEGFVERLHGMFAFALFDKRCQRLWLVRDRLGIKPLFFCETNEGVFFASEQKALREVSGDAVSDVALIQYLEAGFSAGAQTVLQNVQRVLPGECVLVEAGGVQVRRYYWQASTVASFRGSHNEAVATFEQLMTDVTHEHIRSDVPFALFLSGGIDSAVVHAWLQRVGVERIQAFTVKFEDARHQDDVAAAQQLAAQYGLPHEVIPITGEQLWQHLPFAVWAADDLIADYAILPTSLMARRVAQDFKVVFSGEGGDELFAGYGRYRRSGVQRWLANVLHPGSGGFRTQGLTPSPWRGKLYGAALQRAAEQRRAAFIAAWRAAPRHWSSLQRCQYVDVLTDLPERLLVKADRMLMAWGLEGRVPLLDHRLVEFALGLPDGYKVSRKEGKLFLKHWLTQTLPPALVHRKKRGFSVPVGAWLKGKTVQRLLAVLPRHPAVVEWFDPVGVKALLARQAVVGDVERTVWALVQFALWHSLFVVGKGVMPPVFCDPVDILADRAAGVA
jgi:asparagine synthase (glutamine-hydrolysing)